MTFCFVLEVRSEDQHCDYAHGDANAADCRLILDIGQEADTHENAESIQ
jgi:hypothetical protein